MGGFVLSESMLEKSDSSVSHWQFLSLFLVRDPMFIFFCWDL